MISGEIYGKQPWVLVELRPCRVISILLTLPDKNMEFATYRTGKESARLKTAADAPVLK